MTTPDIDALLAADAIRFANQLHAWIETDDGRIVRHGMSGSGRLGSTTVRLGSHGLTFAGVALPDIAPPRRGRGGAGPLHPDRGRPHRHRGAPAGGAPALLAADRSARLVHDHADPARRRVVGGPAHQREPVPAPLPLRHGGPAHAQERPAPVSRLAAGIGQTRHTMGRHAGAGPGGQRELGRRAVSGEHDSRVRGLPPAPAACRRLAQRTDRSPTQRCTCCSTAYCSSRSISSQRPKRARAPFSTRCCEPRKVKITSPCGRKPAAVSRSCPAAGSTRQALLGAAAAQTARFQARHG